MYSNFPRQRVELTELAELAQDYAGLPAGSFVAAEDFATPEALAAFLVAEAANATRPRGG